MDAGAGNLVFDLKLVYITEDENDRGKISLLLFYYSKTIFLTKEYFITGYYDDIAVSQEEILKTAQSFKRDVPTQNIDP